MKLKTRIAGGKIQKTKRRMSYLIVTDSKLTIIVTSQVYIALQLEGLFIETFLFKKCKLYWPIFLPVDRSF